MPQAIQAQPGRDSPPFLPEAATHWIRRGKERWCIHPAWTERILGPDAPNWFRLGHEARATRIKKGHRRAIWRVRLDEVALFVKTADVRGIRRGPLGRWFRGDLRREWSIAGRAAQRGVPLVRYVALGLGGEHVSRHVLISEEHSDAVPLSVHLRKGVPSTDVGVNPTARRRVLTAVVHLYAISHTRGFVHLDGHPGNVLVALPKEQAATALFVDVGRAEIGRPPAGLGRSVASLAQLGHAVRHWTTRTERMRFLRLYLRLRPGSERVTRGRLWVKELWRVVDRRAGVHAERLARHRDRRLFRNGKYFGRIVLGAGWTALVVLRLKSRRAAPRPFIMERTRDEWRTLWDRWHVMKADQPNGPRKIAIAPGLAAEFQTAHRFLQRLVWTIRGSPHRRAFLQSHRRLHRDQSTEPLLAVAEHRRWGLIDQSVIIWPDNSEPPVQPEAEAESHHFDFSTF